MYLFVDAVLVDGPHGRDMSVEQLRQRHFLVAGPGADKPSLAHGCVAHHDALHQFLMRLFVIHHLLLLNTSIPST